MMKRAICFFLSAILIFSLCAVSVPYVSAAGDLKVSEDCVALIKAFEGFTPKPVYDYAQYSVGYGSSCKSTDYPNGITEAEADKLLRADLAKLEPKVNDFASRNGLKLSQQQFDALISFTYNLGASWMNNTSTFRKAVIEGSKGNDLIFAITMWCNAGGAIVNGLVQRRLAEANLYLNGVYAKNPPSNYHYVIFHNNLESAVTTVKIQGFDARVGDQIRAVPSKVGYRFLGWYTQAEGGEWVTTVSSSTGTNALYAHWQADGAVPAEGIPANYVRYAADNQPVYNAPNGTKTKTLQEGTKLNIVADCLDSNDDKWGKLSGGGWVELTGVQDLNNVVQGDPVNLKVTVTANDVNVRIGPGTGYPKAGKVNKGQELQLTHVKKGGTYLWGHYSSGWVCLDYTDYAIVSAESSGDANKVTATGVIVNTNKLNIRSKPSASSTKVGQYSKGDKVEITLQQKVGSTTWGKTKKGWISLYYVQLTPVADETPVETTPPAEIPTVPAEPVTPTEPAAPETSAPEKTEVIATGKIIDCTTLRVRAGAGTKYDKVGSLAVGTKVNLYEMTVVGSQVWGRIDSGWICMEYVKLDAASAGSGNSAIKQTGTVVDCTNLNVRAGAGTMYARVGKLARGTQVEILDTATVGRTVWGRIDEGWVSMDYIKLTVAASGDKPQTDSTTTTQPDNSTGTGSGSTGASGGTEQVNPGTTQTVNKTGVIIGTAQLRVRSAPGVSSKEVGTLKKGDRVVILETTKFGNATWGRTEAGWIHMFYVRLDSTEVPAGAIVRTVTASSLKIRAGAGTSYDAVGSYLRGTQVVITEQTTVKGKLWGRTDKGWISMEYVK